MRRGGIGGGSSPRALLRLQHAAPHRVGRRRGARRGGLGARVGGGETDDLRSLRGAVDRAVRGGGGGEPRGVVRSPVVVVVVVVGRVVVVRAADDADVVAASARQLLRELLLRHLRAPARGAAEVVAVEVGLAVRAVLRRAREAPVAPRVHAPDVPERRARGRRGGERRGGAGGSRRRRPREGAGGARGHARGLGRAPERRHRPGETSARRRANRARACDGLPVANEYQVL